MRCCENAGLRRVRRLPSSTLNLLVDLVGINRRRLNLLELEDPAELLLRWEYSKSKQLSFDYTTVLKILLP